MTTYALTVSSPEGDLFCGRVVRLSARGVEGELAVLAGHVPFATPLVACDCTIELENGEIRTGHTDGGLLTVAHEKVTLLSGSFVWKQDE